MTSYPEVPGVRDAAARDAVKDYVESFAAGEMFSIYDLMNGTNLEESEVKRGMHYYRNAQTPFIQRGGWYWLSSDPHETMSYRDAILRNVRTRTVTAISTLEAFEPTGRLDAMSKQQKLIRTTLRDSRRVVEDIDEVLTR